MQFLITKAMRTKKVHGYAKQDTYSAEYPSLDDYLKKIVLNSDNHHVKDKKGKRVELNLSEVLKWVLTQPELKINLEYPHEYPHISNDIHTTYLLHLVLLYYNKPDLLEAVKLLIEKFDYGVNLKDTDNYLPIQFAAGFSTPDVVDYLMGKGANYLNDKFELYAALNFGNVLQVCKKESSPTVLRHMSYNAGLMDYIKKHPDCLGALFCRAVIHCILDGSVKTDVDAIFDNEDLATMLDEIIDKDNVHVHGSGGRSDTKVVCKKFDTSALAKKYPKLLTTNQGQTTNNPNTKIGLPDVLKIAGIAYLAYFIAMLGNIIFLMFKMSALPNILDVANPAFLFVMTVWDLFLYDHLNSGFQVTQDGWIAVNVFRTFQYGFLFASYYQLI